MERGRGRGRTQWYIVSCSRHITQHSLTTTGWPNTQEPLSLVFSISAPMSHKYRTTFIRPVLAAAANDVIPLLLNTFMSAPSERTMVRDCPAKPKTTPASG